MLVQGGLSTGRTLTDSCEVRAVVPEARILAGAGYHLLLIDLRGHGLSEGDQLTYGYREAWDVQTAVDYLALLGSLMAPLPPVITMPEDNSSS